MSMVTWAERTERAPYRATADLRHPAIVSEVPDPEVSLAYQPILDVARGVVAGYQAQVRHLRHPATAVHSPWTLDGDADGSVTAAALRVALSDFATLPVNTFLSFPLAALVAALPPVRDVLLGAPTLAGIVLDIADTTEVEDGDELAATLAGYRAAGALISLGGHGAPQPELTSIVELKPSIVRVGRDWVRDIDTSKSKRSAVEVIGTLAGQLDAWILAEGVSTAAELRTLASLSVPLAQGSFIGEARASWSDIPPMTRQVLPRVAAPTDGALRSLVQSAYTATDLTAAAAVLPETTGFDVVVIVDEHQHPVSVLEADGRDGWQASDVLAVNLHTPVNDAVARAMARPRATRFSPLACTDDQGVFLGVLRIERLMEHLSTR